MFATSPTLSQTACASVGWNTSCPSCRSTPRFRSAYRVRISPRARSIAPAIRTNLSTRSVIGNLESPEDRASDSWPPGVFAGTLLARSGEIFLGAPSGPAALGELRDFRPGLPRTRAETCFLSGIRSHNFSKLAVRVRRRRRFDLIGKKIEVFLRAKRHIIDTKSRAHLKLPSNIPEPLNRHTHPTRTEHRRH